MDALTYYTWAAGFVSPPEVPVKPVPKGTCPKCGKHVGRGVHFHAKRCKG